MAATANKKLDWSKIAKRTGKTMSIQEALKDVVPFDWDDDVLNGTAKIVVSHPKEVNCLALSDPSLASG